MLLHPADAKLLVGGPFLGSCALFLSSREPLLTHLFSSPPEILPLTVRAKGVSLSTATNWAFNFLVGEITPFLQEHIEWRLYPMHGFFCVCSFIVGESPRDLEYGSQQLTNPLAYSVYFRKLMHLILLSQN